MRSAAKVMLIVLSAALSMFIVAGCSSGGGSFSAGKKAAGDFDAECPVVGAVGPAVWTSKQLSVSTSLSCTNIDKEKLSKLEKYSVELIFNYQDSKGNDLVSIPQSIVTKKTGSGTASTRIDDQLIYDLIKASTVENPSEVEVYVSCVDYAFKDGTVVHWGFDSNYGIIYPDKSSGKYEDIKSKAKLLGSTHISAMK